MARSTPALIGLFASPRHAAARLGALLGFAAVQVVAQGIGFLVGLMLVRWLPVHEYALYTLAMSMIGIAAVLLDLGLGNALLARAGALAADRTRWAALLADAHALQAGLMGIGVPMLATGCVAVLVWQQQAAWHYAMLITLLVIAISMLQLRSGLTLALLRVQGELAVQQKLELGINVAKALAVCMLGLVLTAGLSAALALAVNLVAASMAGWFLLRWRRDRLPPLGRAGGEHRAALRSLVMQQAPNSLYYCLSGQITIWLVAVLGDARGVAEVGALGRIAVVFTIVGAVVASVVQPYFAREQEARRLQAAFVLVNLTFACATAALWMLAAQAPEAVLWILGEAYRDLQPAVPWMVLASCLSSWSGAVYLIGSARGWVPSPKWVIGTGVTSIAACVVWLDVSTAAGAFQMNTVTSGIATLLCLLHAGSRMRREAVTGHRP